MYTLTKGPSKFVASARRGPPRQLGFEGYDNRDKSSRSQRNCEEVNDSTSEMSHPRPTFRRLPTNRRPPPMANEIIYTDNHMETAQLLIKQWKKVSDLLKSGKEGDSYEVYREKEQNRDLEDFQPYLERVRYGRTYLGKSPS
ncbi:protein fam195a [Plakobranchus ocellatus]|uniref:Protein fam195a n=1 Tax=Plakobranchus ocellatus TaxID=259542 RepID=A0AAV3ZB91_9GAST|nr:protein fam195a [Plakobranchus ocellatus]